MGNLVQLERLPSDEKMKELRAITKESSTKLLVSFGGNGRSNGFSDVAVKKSHRQRFVRNVIELINRYDLDGVDLNWEYPQNEREWTGLFQTIKLLKVRRPQTTLTMAFYPGQERVLCTPLASKYGLSDNVDLFLMMSYDNVHSAGSKHSTFEFAEQTVRNALREGMRADKLALGLPFYARSTQNGDWKTYEEIVREWRESGGDDADIEEMKGRDVVGEHYYNGYHLIAKKTKFALETAIGGVMIWENGQDVHDDELSLLRAITETVNGYRSQKEHGHEEL